MEYLLLLLAIFWVHACVVHVLVHVFCFLMFGESLAAHTSGTTAARRGIQSRCRAAATQDASILVAVLTASWTLLWRRRKIWTSVCCGMSCMSAFLLGAVDEMSPCSFSVLAGWSLSNSLRAFHVLGLAMSHENQRTGAFVSRFWVANTAKAALNSICGCCNVELIMETQKRFRL